MKKDIPPTTGIAQAYPDKVVNRGFDLCKDLIGHSGFTEHMLLLLLGERAGEKLVKLVDATLIAIAEHGLVPSVQASRMTLAAAPDSLQGAVAAGLLGCGPVILGASESAGLMLEHILRASAQRAIPVRDAADDYLRDLQGRGGTLPGFGHPLHKPEDPRAIRLLEYARELGTCGRYVEALEAVLEAVPGVYGRSFPVNVSGAIAAVLLDGGFPMRALKGIPLVARCASLVAHLLEEQSNPIGFKLADLAAGGVTYLDPKRTGSGS